VHVRLNGGGKVSLVCCSSRVLCALLCLVVCLAGVFHCVGWHATVWHATMCSTLHHARPSAAGVVDGVSYRVFLCKWCVDKSE